MISNDFVDNVKKWVSLDNQIRKANDDLKNIRLQKHQISNQICTFMKNQNINEKKIEISDGSIRFYEKKEYSPLTYTYIEKCLTDIIKDTSQVTLIMNYLKDKREIKVSNDLKRNTFS
jgi:hypothetical protein